MLFNEKIDIRVERNLKNQVKKLSKYISPRDILRLGVKQFLHENPHIKNLSDMSDKELIVFDENLVSKLLVKYNITKKEEFHETLTVTKKELIKYGSLDNIPDSFYKFESIVVDMEVEDLKEALRCYFEKNVES